MDFRRQKLRLTLVVMAIGMAVALAWHGWQGWGLGRDYPNNTFLFLPTLRFSDLSTVVDASCAPRPYASRYSVYFPASFVIFRPLAYMVPNTAAYLFLGITSFGLLAALFVALRPVFARIWQRMLCAIALFLLSYPVVLCIDRANIEILMAALTAMALLLFNRRCFWLGLACLFPAVCMKFYPIILTVLFVRPRHLFKPPLVAAAFFIVTLGSLAAFGYSIEENWERWHYNLRFFQEIYVIYNWGFEGSASLWNTGKALLISGYYLYDPTFDARYRFIPLDLLHQAFSIYKYLAFAGLMAVTSYVVLIEREFFRRAILLLLIMTLSAPSGGDYRLLYVNIALVILILMPARRRHDLLVTGLLAFVLIPKKEIFLPFLGSTDSSFHDISIAILINPPCLLAVMILLIRDGLRDHPWIHLSQRFFGLTGAVQHFFMSFAYQKARRPNRGD